MKRLFRLARLMKQTAAVFGVTGRRRSGLCLLWRSKISNEHMNSKFSLTSKDIEELRNAEFEGAFKDAFKALVREHALAVNKLTGDQLAEAIRQACACGDFQRYLAVNKDGDSAQRVVYLPFAEKQRLEARIRELEAEIEILRDYDDIPD